MSKNLSKSIFLQIFRRFFSTDKLVIIEAEYGNDNKYIDISKELNALITDNKLQVVLSNGIPGYDPVPSKLKIAKIKYSYGGKISFKKYNENDKIILPPSNRNTNTQQKLYERWWVKELVFPLIVLLLGAFLVYKNGWNSSFNKSSKKNLGQQTEPDITALPAVKITPKTGLVTPTMDTPSQTENIKMITIGDTYIDPDLGVIIGVQNISVYRTASISTSLPFQETNFYKDIKPGKAFHFIGNKHSYSVIVKTISYIGGYIEIYIKEY